MDTKDVNSRVLGETIRVPPGLDLHVRVYVIYRTRTNVRR